MNRPSAALETQERKRLKSVQAILLIPGIAMLLNRLSSLCLLERFVGRLRATHKNSPRILSKRRRQGEPKARLQQKIEEVDARPLAEVYERTRKRKVNDQSSPLGERWSVVNLSFSFRTPSTSSYLLVGVNEREDRRLPTVDSRTRVTVG